MVNVTGTSIPRATSVASVAVIEIGGFAGTVSDDSGDAAAADAGGGAAVIASVSANGVASIDLTAAS